MKNSNICNSINAVRSNQAPYSFFDQTFFSEDHYTTLSKGMRSSDPLNNLYLNVAEINNTVPTFLKFTNLFDYYGNKLIIDCTEILMQKVSSCFGDKRNPVDITILVNHGKQNFHTDILGKSLIRIAIPFVGKSTIFALPNSTTYLKQDIFYECIRNKSLDSCNKEKHDYLDTISNIPPSDYESIPRQQGAVFAINIEDSNKTNNAIHSSPASDDNRFSVFITYSIDEYKEVIEQPYESFTDQIFSYINQAYDYLIA